MTTTTNELPIKGFYGYYVRGNFVFSRRHIKDGKMLKGSRKDIITLIPTKVGGDDKEISYDPAAGTGQLVIRDWWLTRKLQMPWEYKPMDHLVVCSELSVKTIPFLLLNLSIRGICGMVFHANSMTNEIYQVYVLTNEKNDPLHYSDVTLAGKDFFKEFSN